MLRQLGWGLAGATATLVALEIVLRLLPTSTATLTGYYIHPMLLTYPPGHHWKVATGWDLRNAQHLRANNFGYASEREFVPDSAAVALVGDSFVEASMLDPHDRPAEQLADALQRTRPVYGMGMPGSSLLDYAERICFAADRLDVRDFVVLLESSDVRQSLCGSGNVHGPCLDRETRRPQVELQADASTLKRFARHSALAQYAFGQLKVDPYRLLERAFARSVPAEPGAEVPPPLAEPAQGPALPTPAQVRQVEALANAFFARAMPCVRGRLVLLMDGRRERDEPPSERQLVREIRAERKLFMENVRARSLPNVSMLDADGIYHAYTSRSPLALVVGPYDAHLNRVGIGLLMRAAAGDLDPGRRRDPAARSSP